MKKLNYLTSKLLRTIQTGEASSGSKSKENCSRNGEDRTCTYIWEKHKRRCGDERICTVDPVLGGLEMEGGPVLAAHDGRDRRGLRVQDDPMATGDRCFCARRSRFIKGEAQEEEEEDEKGPATAMAMVEHGERET